MNGLRSISMDPPPARETLDPLPKRFNPPSPRLPPSPKGYGATSRGQAPLFHALALEVGEPLLREGAGRVGGGFSGPKRHFPFGGLAFERLGREALHLGSVAY